MKMIVVTLRLTEKIKISLFTPLVVVALEIIKNKLEVNMKKRVNLSFLPLNFCS